MLVRIANKEDSDQTDRLHLQKQSDLGLCCLFWQAIIVQNFRTSTVLDEGFHETAKLTISQKTLMYAQIVRPIFTCRLSVK